LEKILRLFSPSKCLHLLFLFLLGRSFEESFVDKFIMTIPSTHEVIQEIEKFPGVYSCKGEQHVELRPSWITRDLIDVNKLVTWFQAHLPFPLLKEIMCIADGTIGDSRVNCFEAYKAGSKILAEIVGTDFNNLKLKESNYIAKQ